MKKLLKSFIILSACFIIPACSDVGQDSTISKRNEENCVVSAKGGASNTLDYKNYAKGDFKVGSAYKQKGKQFSPKVDLNYVESGYASWYGPGFHGQKTANGAMFDEDDYTAAHRTLPLPSVVRVVNLENKKSIIVVVNDRGPFNTTHGGKRRIIDLSKKAAADLGMLQKGIAKVKVEYLHEETKELVSHLPTTHKNKALAMYKKAKGEKLKSGHAIPSSLSGIVENKG